MGVWRDGASEPGRELVVALVLRQGDLDRRADDREFAVAWESNGTDLREVQRLPMSCADVELVVPNRGPYVYEARLDASPWSLHPECACQPSPGRPCPNGVHVEGETSWSLRSPIDSHFVSLENEWREPIADEAVLGRLVRDLLAPVAVVSRPLLNSTHQGALDPALACPGTRDNLFGSHDVTLELLAERGMRLPDDHVRGSWCLVRRGGCSETAKAKVCEVSGGVGVIIVDHGSFAGDQQIVIRYSRAADEWARTLPILFVSAGEGRALAGAAAAAGGARVRVGPSVGGPAPEGFLPGSGITVHTLGGRAPSAASRRAWPELFGTAGWLEVSGVRDLLFVCLPSRREIQIFNVSRPLEEVPLVGRISIACSRRGWHDYRVLDYAGSDGHFHTLLVDPVDNGNRLYYYDTDRPSSPRLELELHARWEAEADGLGQVRPGGADGRYHLITWHCSDLFCGKRHGDSLYILDTQQLTRPAVRVPLPMLSRGGFARDVACGAEHLCLVSLTWDGLVIVDTGAEGTRNLFKVVAESAGEQPFGSADIPYGQARMRMYSGAQKVYASHLNPRRFYVEHADFDIRHLRIGDDVRALQLREVYAAELVGYDAREPLPGPPPSPSAAAGVVLDAGGRLGGLRSEPHVGIGPDKDDELRADVPVEVLLTMLGLMTLLMALLVVLMFVNRHHLFAGYQPADSPSPTGGRSSVVLGRPVENSSDVHATPGHPVPCSHGGGVGPMQAW